MLVTGVIIFRTVLVDGHVTYVRPGLGWLLVLAAGVLILVSLASLWSGTSHKEPGHGHSPRVGWLIMLPVLALISVPEVPLGAFAAGLGGGQTPVPRAAVDFAPLVDPENGARNLSVNEFVSRSLYAPESLEGEPVRLAGFAAPDTNAPSGYLLTRFTIGCCAADAWPMQVAVVNDAPREADSWIEVVGVYQPGVAQAPGESSPPQLKVVEARTISAPDNPYEY
jgi:uncharacterized repeat protein (TIGR03943 family)